MIDTYLRLARFLLLVSGMWLLTTVAQGAVKAPFIERVSVQLNWKHQNEFAAFYAALHQGYYQDAGLNVHIQEGGPGIDAVKEVVEGRAEFGVGTSALIVDRYRGMPVVALATLMQHSPIGLLALRRNGIQSVHDLANRPVAVDPHSRDEIEAYLRASGIPAEKIQLVDQTDWTLDSLDKELVAAKTVYLSNEPFLIHGKEHEYLLLTPRSAGIDLFGNMLFSTESMIRSHPATVKAFRGATLKGLSYALDHPQEITDLILARYNTQHKSREHLLFEADQIRELTRHDIVEPGYMKAGRWRHVNEIYARQGKLPVDFDLQNFIYVPNPPDIPAWLVWTFFGTLAGLLTALALLIKFRWLNRKLSHEITERKHMEQELRLSKDRYQLVVNGAGAGIWDWDIADQRIFYSSQWKTMRGLLDVEITDSIDNLWHGIHPDDAQRVLASMQDHLHGKSPRFSEEYRILCKDNFWKWISNNGIALINDTGLAVRMAGSEIDITERKQAQLAVTESEKQFRTLVENIPGATYRCALDEHWTMYYISQGIEDLTGYSASDFVDNRARSYASIIHPDDRSIVSKKINSVTTLNVPFVLEYRIQHADGEIRWLWEKGCAFSEQDGQITHLDGVLIDITDRKQADERIRTLSQAVEQSPVSVVIADSQVNIQYVNSAFEQMTGYSAAEVIGQNPWITEPEGTQQGLFQAIRQAIKQGGSWHGELQNHKKNSEELWERAHISPVLDPSGNIRHYLAVIEDITLHKQQEQRILHQAYYDSLTNLPNRFLCLDRLAQMIKEERRTGKRVALLFLDLDDFKKVNDSLGHQVGDQILVQAARRLQDAVRDTDTIGRLGGDEFVLIMGGLTELTDAYPVAEKLLALFRSPFRLGSRELVLTASLGIAIYPDDGESPAELLRNADTAMYHSKEHGRNTYHYYTHKMNQGVYRRLALEEQLHSALENGELSLSYQPLVEIGSRTLIGAEALSRWNNPQLGNVSPAEFIPVAEQTGLILPIGRYVLSQALEMLAKWRAQGNRDFKIAINISPRQFYDPNLLPFIEQALQLSGIPAESLELEITEGVLMSGNIQIDKTLTGLKHLGVSISMDDFGTGYSSLSYLRRYPFDILKIDRSFIQDIIVDSADRELVNATIAMAHGLGLLVVAEGVETEEQLAYLLEQGCDMAQGYLFSKPVSGAEITTQLELPSVQPSCRESPRR